MLLTVCNSIVLLFIMRNASELLESPVHRQTWCSTLAYTVFHYPTRANVCPWVVQCMLHDALCNPGGVQEWVFHWCMPLLCTVTWEHTGMLHWHLTGVIDLLSSIQPCIEFSKSPKYLENCL